jgi:hypothetical protein
MLYPFIKQLNTVVKILGPTKAPLLNREVITYRNGITDRKIAFLNTLFS